jgi:hypothetical protein
VDPRLDLLTALDDDGELWREPDLAYLEFAADNPFAGSGVGKMEIVVLIDGRSLGNACVMVVEFGCCVSGDIVMLKLISTAHGSLRFRLDPLEDLCGVLADV